MFVEINPSCGANGFLSGHELKNLSWDPKVINVFTKARQWSLS
jgi:hypothetical protein